MIMDKIQLTIKEDPINKKSLIIEKWINKFMEIYPNLVIRRLFVTNEEKYQDLVAFINELQIQCSERLFAYVHYLKEYMHIKKEKLSNDLLDEIAIDVACCNHFPNLKVQELDQKIDGFILELQKDNQIELISEDFKQIENYIESFSQKKIVPLNSAYIQKLFDSRLRLSWDELLFLYKKESHKELVTLLSKLLSNRFLKMKKIGETVIIALPSLTHCCEGDECLIARSKLI